MVRCGPGRGSWAGARSNPSKACPPGPAGPSSSLRCLATRKSRSPGRGTVHRTSESRFTAPGRPTCLAITLRKTVTVAAPRMEGRAAEAEPLTASRGPVTWPGPPVHIHGGRITRRVLVSLRRLPQGSPTVTTGASPRRRSDAPSTDWHHVPDLRARVTVCAWHCPPGLRSHASRLIRFSPCSRLRRQY